MPLLSVLFIPLNQPDFGSLPCSRRSKGDGVLRGAGSLRSQPSPGLCWTQRCRDTGPEAHPALSGGELGGLPTHPSPSSHQGQCRPGGHSLDELPSKGFQLARRCCRCQQQVQALPRQHVTQDPQQALRGLGVIRIHGLQKNKKQKKNRGKRSHGECVLQCSSKTPAVRAELIGCQSCPVRPR